MIQGSDGNPRKTVQSVGRHQSGSKSNKERRRSDRENSQSRQPERRSGGETQNGRRDTRTLENGQPRLNYPGDSDLNELKNDLIGRRHRHADDLRSIYDYELDIMAKVYQRTVKALLKRKSTTWQSRQRSQRPPSRHKKGKSVMSTLKRMVV